MNVMPITIREGDHIIGHYGARVRVLKDALPSASQPGKVLLATEICSMFVWDDLTLDIERATEVG